MTEHIPHQPQQSGHPSQPQWQPGAPSYGQAPPPGWQPPGATRADAKAQAKAAKAYSKSLRPWWKRKRVLIPAGLGGLILAGSAAGAGGTDPSSSSPSAAGSASSSSAEAWVPPFPGAEESDVVGQAGDTLTLGNVRVEAGPLTVESEQYIGEQLCSTVTYTNDGDTGASFSSFEWKLQDPGGAVLDTTMPVSDDYLRSGELRPGGTVTGDVCFERQGPGDYVLLNAPLWGDRGAWLNGGL